MMAPVNSLLEKTEHNPKTLEIAEIATTTQIPELTELPQIAKTPDVTETPKSTKILEPTELPKTAKTPDSGETPKTLKTTNIPKTAHPSKTSLEPPKTPETKESLSLSVELAAQDVRRVIDQQKEQNQTLTTKLNILFVTNGALFTSLTVSRLVFFPGVFSLAELLGFLVNFTLLINAFLPRQLAISPNLGDKKFLERYLVLSPEEYQLQMIVNLVETYNANKQRLEDVSSSLQYAAYVTWSLALVITLHVLAIYFLPTIDFSSFG